MQWLKWNMNTDKWWNWRSCAKVALGACSTHGLIAQLVRSPELNSVVVGSNPICSNFLYVYICLYVYIYVWCMYVFNNRTGLEYNRMSKVSRKKYVFHITIYFCVIYNYYLLWLLFIIIILLFIPTWFKLKKYQVENI